MTERGSLDLVAVCTQAPQHAPIVTDAARLGVEGILCERPVAPTRVEADRMLEVCSRAGTRPAVDHQTRTIPPTFLVERPLRDGAIGDLRAARMPDKGGRPAGNSLLERPTHVFDLLRLYAGDPAWVSAHLTQGTQAAGEDVDATARWDAPQRLATIDDIVCSQMAWPTVRDCGLVLGDRCGATCGFGPRAGWHGG
jgi:predicted dehydrogenase